MHVFDAAVAHAIPFIPRALIRRLSGRYIAGATLAEALDTVAQLNARGLGVTLDVLGESAASAAEADAMAGAYAAAIAAIADRGLDAELSLKPTALGLLADEGACEARVRGIIDLAVPSGIGTCLDMEDVRCTQKEIDLIGRLDPRGVRLGIALQAYLKRSYGDLDRLLRSRIRVRICKGIYVEHAVHLVEGAERDRSAINTHFLAHVARCFEAKVFVSVATHDEGLVEAVMALAQRLRLVPEAFEFQMLLGVCEPLRDRVRDRGYPVRVYVPFGTDWYGYSTRRLKENPRIAGHVFRAMFRR